jgi:predicted ATPase/class 3 adenylate cyclase
MTTLPVGTVTFLFTDIEGSTKLWEQYPAAMQLALARHDAVLRHAIEAHEGCVVKLRGDGFHAAFATASDALNACLATQRELQALNNESANRKSQFAIRIRMALHTGTAELREGDYYGTALNRAARLMAAGHGGQILLSHATQELVRDQLPAQVTLRDMGERRLKDLTRPERIFQVVAPDLPADFPSLKTLDTLPNNLPIQLTSFVGREQAMAEVKRLLVAWPDSQVVASSNQATKRPSDRLTTRLLTLTGSGGTGKTRLSLQVAAEVLDMFADGVWLIELAPLADPALVPQTIATTLGVREEPNHPVLATLTDYLRAKQLLLILDNCEHLIEACAQLADALLHACPRLHILASSREALGIAGETTYRVPSLSCPDPRQVIGAGSKPAPTQPALHMYEAVRLFIDRAVSAQPHFTVTNANAPTVAQICQRLDGIPLAIELAAARVKGLKVEQIAQRLDDRFRLLTGGSRTALPRQQTLRALIDWSYGLLSEQERSLLRRLSVFAGGWTIEAAEAVCGDDGRREAKNRSLPSIDTRLPSPVLRQADVLDLLLRLVDKSLVVVDEESNGDSASWRYRLLETVRQYAREKLLDTSEGERVRDQHLAYFVELGEAAAPQLQSGEVNWLNRLELELDNVRAALDWSKDTGRNEDGLRLATALFWFWNLRGHQAEGVDWLQSLLAQSMSPENTTVRAYALLNLGGIYWRQGNFAEAYLIAERALAIGEGLNHRPIIAQAYHQLGANAASQDHYAAAQSWYAHGLELHRALDDKKSISQSLFGMGLLALRQGDDARAQTLFAEVIRLQQELADKNIISATMRQWGRALLHQSDYQGARAKFRESLVDNLEIGDKQAVAACLAAFAALALAQEELLRAAQLFGASDAVSESIRTELLPHDRDECKRNLAMLRTQLDEVAFNAAWEAGRRMTMEEAVKLALEGTENH